MSKNVSLFRVNSFDEGNNNFENHQKGLNILKRFLFILVAMVMALSACGTNDDYNNDGGGTENQATDNNGAGDNTGIVDDKDKDTETDNGRDDTVSDDGLMDDMGDAVDDAANGVGNAAKDVVDGAENAIDDVTGSGGSTANNNR